MASQGVISTGSCIAFTATAPATLDEAGYAALTWPTDWEEVTQYGSIGPTTNITSYKTVCDGVVNKRPASKDFGNMTLEAASVDDNANQVVLQTAIDATPVTPVYARLTLSSGAIRYFRAYPGSLEDNIGDADAMLMVSVDLAVDGEIVRVAAP